MDHGFESGSVVSAPIRTETNELHVTGTTDAEKNTQLNICFVLEAGDCADGP